VRLVRAHLEEDAGKSLHEDFIGQSGIDLNRAGTPLLEIVTEPDIRSSAEAVAYAKELHKIVTWIGICDGNMQEGSSAATPTCRCASPARRWARAARSRT
jgi:aspartyl-tRNA(Asn)/glutamyl-tRNA(Gln) amidotransferase subunit B